jgi:hypothetical protein
MSLAVVLGYLYLPNQLLIEHNGAISMGLYRFLGQRLGLIVVIFIY